MFNIITLKLRVMLDICLARHSKLLEFQCLWEFDAFKNMNPMKSYTACSVIYQVHKFSDTISQHILFVLTSSRFNVCNSMA